MTENGPHPAAPWYSEAAVAAILARQNRLDSLMVREMLAVAHIATQAELEVAGLWHPAPVEEPLTAANWEGDGA
jgi:hypothetical protein